jgi:hypothetical protein
MDGQHAGFEMGTHLGSLTKGEVHLRRRSRYDKPAEASTSFLKKRSKRLLVSGHGLDTSRPWPENKSSLVLFF